MKIISYKVVESTNLKAKDLVKKKAKPWTVVVSERQSQGYGRKGNKWYSPKGGLYFSIILPLHSEGPGRSLQDKLKNLQILTILAAFAVGKVIKNNFALEPFIKLPNDVWINGKKIAGILVENVIGKRLKSSIMGIGVNTNIVRFPKELENKATSLKKELGKKVDNRKILKEIVKEIKAFF